MIEIKQNKEDGIIHVQRKGDIFTRDLIEMIKRIDMDYRSQEKLYILDDTRGSVSKFDHRQDFEKMINELEMYVDNYERIYLALVSDNPATSALSDIYTMRTSKITNYYYKTFSSPEAARTWLKMSI